MTQSPSRTSRRSRELPSTLYRCRRHAVVAGVAAGVAEYLEIDSTLVRSLWAASLLIGGFGLVAYVILWIALDERPCPPAALNRGPTTPGLVSDRGERSKPRAGADSYCLDC